VRHRGPTHRKRSEAKVCPILWVRNHCVCAYACAVNEEWLDVLTSEAAEGLHLVRRDNQRSIGPLFVSWGQVNLLCGACDYLLMARIPRREALAGVAVECPNCGSLNGV